MIRVLFFGTPRFSAHILSALADCPDISVVGVVTNPDKPAGRGKHLTPSSVKDRALALSIPVIQPGSIKKSLDKFIHDVDALGDIDIGVVVAFGQILPKAVLNLPKAGCVNIHASLLPRWRGAAPIQRAIMSGDTQSGVCLMQMEEGLDTGPVYSSITVPITPSDTAGSLHDALSEAGAKLIVRDIAKIASGDLKPTPQTVNGVTYADKIKNDEALISWNQNAQQICRHIHGLSPHPGAFTTLGGQRLKVFNAIALPRTGEQSKIPLGTITRCEGHELRVACMDGEVALLDLQLEGRKRLSAQEFIKGLSAHSSLVLGDPSFSTASS